MLRHTLGKEERIYLRSELQTLFASRGSFVCYPFRVIYHTLPRQEEALKMMVSVPKKRLKHAVERNRIKRLTREAFRQNKELLLTALPDSDTLLIGYVYIGEGVKSYKSVTKGVTESLTKLSNRYEQANEGDS